jgi:hypothetical protein
MIDNQLSKLRNWFQRSACKHQILKLDHFALQFLRAEEVNGC